MPTIISRTKSARLLFWLSLVVFSLIVLFKLIVTDVYRHAVIGVLYELTWLTLLLSLPIVTLTSSIIAFRTKGPARPYAIAALLLVAGSVLVIVLSA